MIKDQEITKDEFLRHLPNNVLVAIHAAIANNLGSSFFWEDDLAGIKYYKLPNESVYIRPETNSKTFGVNISLGLDIEYTAWLNIQAYGILITLKVLEDIGSGQLELPVKKEYLCIFKNDRFIPFEENLNYFMQVPEENYQQLADYMHSMILNQINLDKSNFGSDQFELINMLM